MTSTITGPTHLPGPAATSSPSRAVEAGLEGTRRPRRALLFYYFLQSLITGPGIIVLLPLRFFRFRTLRYRFDPDGVTMRWGILFRREVSLTYARIQDIHLVSNVIERWLGLGRVQIQTASGNAAAEMTIEGLPDYEQVRNELYVRMRGARGQRAGSNVQRADAGSGSGSELAEVAAALQETAAELRALRELLSRNGAQ